jgi:hypothetical protein
VVGVGAQDDFDYALDFLESTGVETPTMLWDPSRETWRSFGVSINSQMMLLTPDLSAGTELFYGFGEDDRAAILEALSEFG